MVPCQCVHSCKSAVRIAGCWGWKKTIYTMNSRQAMRKFPSLIAQGCIFLGGKRIHLYFWGDDDDGGRTSALFYHSTESSHSVHLWGSSWSCLVGLPSLSQCYLEKTYACTHTLDSFPGLCLPMAFVLELAFCMCTSTSFPTNSSPLVAPVLSLYQVALGAPIELCHWVRPRGARWRAAPVRRVKKAQQFKLYCTRLWQPS